MRLGLDATLDTGHRQRVKRDLARDVNGSIHANGFLSTIAKNEFLTKKQTLTIGPNSSRRLVRVQRLAMNFRHSAGFDARHGRRRSGCTKQSACLTTEMKHLFYYKRKYLCFQIY